MFYIISLFAAEFEEPKIGISGKGLTAKVISWQSMTHIIIFPGFLTPELTKPQTTFVTCFSKGER